MASGNVTMKDVVHALGYSVATVSLALSNRPAVATATRRIVVAKAEALGSRKIPSSPR